MVILDRIKDIFSKKAAPVQIGRPFASYQFINGVFVGVDDNKASYITNGYELNDVIYSVVTLVTDKVRLPEWGVYKIQDEQALKSYLGIMRRKDISGEDFKKALHYKKKALELVNAGKLTELMQYPNEYETMQDFAAFSTGYKMLTGDRYIWGEMLQAGANAGKPQYLHVLPSQEVTIIAERSAFPIKEAGYTMSAIGGTFTKEQVLHDKYPNYDWDVNGSHLYGMSPLKAALRRLSRSNSAVKSSAAMFENQGVKGILYMDDPRVMGGNFNVAETTKQVEAVKEKLTRGEWAGAENHGRIGFSGYKLGWQDVGLSPVDLSIIESEKWDLKRFASVYGVPSQLVGDSDTSTYNNVKEAEKALASRCAIPHLTSLRNSLNRKAQGDWGYKGSNYFIDFDQTCFTELQEDIQEKSTWVNQLRVLSPNEQRNLLGLETIDNPLFDEPWITQSDGVPLSEWQIEDNGDMGKGDEDVPDNEA